MESEKKNVLDQAELPTSWMNEVWNHMYPNLNLDGLTFA